MTEATTVASASSRAASAPLATDALLAGATTLLLAGGTVAAQPFVGNQNQYFLPVVAARSSRWDDDWLAQTTDPYPLFTTVTGLVYDAAGTSGLRVVAVLGVWVGLVGVYLLARMLVPLRSRLIPIATVVAVGLLLSPVVGTTVHLVQSQLVRLPLLGGVVEVVNRDLGLVNTNLLRGLAGQYLVSNPGYVQPSLGGSLLLVAVPLWLRGMQRDRERTSRVRALLLAWGLAALACMLHPTYLVATLLGLVCGVVVDVSLGAIRGRLVWYGLAAASIAAVTLAANPALLTLASAVGSQAQARYAFERIPHHTLWPHWPRQDVLLLALLAGALLVAPRLRHGRWLRRWIGGLLAIGLGAALVVDALRPTWLALLFPWRASVVLVPIAATMLIVWGLCSVRRRLPDAPRIPELVTWGLVLAVSLLASLGGVRATMAQVGPAEGDPATALVRRADPVGVGLIPLRAEDVRVNAAVPVYVDWKSPPYTGDDLARWWARVDQVTAFERDPELFCTTDWAQPIDWLLLEEGTPVPSCTGDGETLARSDGWVVVQRVPAGAP